jgi:DNA-binding transcriptional ArsR family regulator
MYYVLYLLQEADLMEASSPASNEENILPENSPIKMPELPAALHVNTAQQFKAIGDQTRWQILDHIQHRPVTAKQVADIMKMSPGTIGHHLQVLEAAGLAQVVARRAVHGIVAKYYTRTARTFIFDFPPELEKEASISLEILTKARNQLADALAEGDMDTSASFPQVRLSPERAQVFRERLKALVNDFIHEPSDPHGQIYGMCMAFFKAPSHQQEFDRAEHAEYLADEQ